MLYQPSNPDLNSLSDMLEKYPRRRVLLFKVMEEIMRNLSPFNKQTRQLLFAYTSDLNQCRLSYDYHKAASLASGLDESVFAALKTDINSAKIDDKLKPILRFIKKLTLTPDQITQADAQQIFDAGWDEHAYFDSVCICAIMNCMNRFVTAIGVDANSPGINHTDKTLFTLGYTG
jgi:alkylhydroperoxidase family enzyme